jgi:hypothetical protein
MPGVGDRTDREQKLACITLINGTDKRNGDRLRWSLMAHGNGLETTRHKRFHVVLRRQLDVVSEQSVHEERVCAALVTLGNGVLTSVMLSASRSGRVGISDGFEARHIDRWVGVSRIVQHRVVNGVETL